MELTEHFRPFLELIRWAINGIGVLIVVWGAVEACWTFIRLRTVEHSSRLFIRASSIRERLGVHLLLALDIFIAADLIATVLHPDWANLALLAVIVLIRVVLSLLLSREIADAHALIEKQGHPDDVRDPER
jgi:uncharacterized membrane protein